MNRKFTSIISLLLLLALASCDDEETVLVQWGIVEFPGENVVYAVYGDLDEYLIVSTSSRILRTTDGGITWDTVKTLSTDPIARFQAINDDLYAISNFVDFISHDRGQTWEALTVDIPLDPPSFDLSDSKRTLYQVVYHHEGELALPTSLLRSINNGNSWENILPYKKVFYSWHIDDDGRVYIGTGGGTWDGQFFSDDNPKYRGFLYYTK